MRIVHDTPGTHLQSLLPSCHVHQTASTSDARWSDVIVRVAQSEEDYKDVGHHRSSLLLRLAVVLRSPCRRCKFLFVCYLFARCIVADDLCVMTKVNSLNTTTWTMTISVINSLVQVHIKSGTSYNIINSLVQVHINSGTPYNIINSLCKYTSTVALHITLSIAWCKYASTVALHITWLIAWCKYKSTVALHIRLSIAWCKYTSTVALHITLSIAWCKQTSTVALHITISIAWCKYTSRVALHS